MKFVNFKIKPVEYKRQSAKLLPLNLFFLKKEYIFQFYSTQYLFININDMRVKSIWWSSWRLVILR